MHAPTGRSIVGRLAPIALVVACLVGLAVPAGAVGVPPSPLPAPDPGSQLISCAQASQRVTVMVSSHLDPSCTYTGGFDITASDVVLDCKGALVANPTASPEGIRIATASDRTMANVTVRNCRVEGFANSLEVVRTGFHDLAAGHEFDHTLSDVVVEDSEFSASRGVGVFVNGYVSGVTLRRLDIHDAGSTGIYLEAGSKQSTVTGNAIHDNGFAQASPAGQLITMGGQQFRYWGTGREGLAIDGSWENTISGNTFEGNAAGGVFVYTNCGEDQSVPSRWFERRYGAERNVIEGNAFTGGLTGVWVGSRMGENTYPMDCSQAAYVDEPLKRIVLDRAADTTVRNNAFEEVTYGIRVEDDGATVTGNTFAGSDATHHAVILGTRVRTSVLGLPVDGTTITGNTSTIVGNPYPYRWVHGHTGTIAGTNTARGRTVNLCQAPQLPYDPFIFARKIALEPVGSPVTPTPDLTPATIGALATCDPGLPLTPLAKPAAGGATVTWSAPTTTGGSPITGYLVTPFQKLVALTAKARTVPAGTLTTTFTTLTDGIAYGYRVQAITAVATGPGAMAPAVVAGVPGAPTGLYLRPGVREATTTGSLIISAARPADNGAPITSWKAACTSSNGGVARTVSVPVTGAGLPSIEIGSLTTAKSYRCTVSATNARGTGPSAVSSAVIVGAPSAPTNPVVTRVAAGQLKLTFGASKANGSPVTVYAATCTSTNGGVTRTKTGGSGMIVTGLTVGTTYRCTVYGHNARGNGVPATFASIVA